MEIDVIRNGFGEAAERSEVYNPFCASHAPGIVFVSAGLVVIAFMTWIF